MTYKKINIIAKLIIITGAVLAFICSGLAFAYEVELSIAAIIGAHMGIVLGVMMIKLGYIFYLEIESQFEAKTH